MALELSAAAWLPRATAVTRQRVLFDTAKDWAVVDGTQASNKMRKTQCAVRSAANMIPVYLADLLSTWQRITVEV